MSTWGSFQTTIRIYTDTLEAQKVLQELRDKFQEAEKKNCEQGMPITMLWEEFHEDAQPKYTEFHLKSGLSPLCRWLDFQISGILYQLNSIHNGSYAVIASWCDSSCGYGAYGAAKYQNVALSECGGGEWTTDDYLTIEITMKLKGWMKLFQQKKEDVLMYMAKQYICTWIFDEKTVDIILDKDPGALVEEMTYTSGSKTYLVFPPNLFQSWEEELEKRYLPMNAVTYQEDDEIFVEIHTPMHTLTRDTAEFLRNDFYEALQYLQQFDENVRLLLHYDNAMNGHYDEGIDESIDEDVYENRMTGYDYTALKFQTGVNRFEMPTVKFPLVNGKQIIYKKK